jgi:hypothetical protein
MLCLDAQRQRFFLSKAVSRPKPIKQLEAQVTPKRLFDDLAVSFARTGSQHLDGSQDLFIDS